jgi:DNA-binding transcriptional ArsR family regulator
VAPRYGREPVIRIELSDDDFSRTRLALSPLWELVASLFLLHRADPPPEHLAWVERTRRTVAGMDLGPLDLRVPYGHCCPDFMAPIPVDPLAGVEDEIERVRATDPDVIHADIAECWPDGPPPPWDRFAARPREMADRLADALHAYWQVALAGDWPRLRAVLEGEVLGRARSLALAGPAAVLEELHPRVRWRAPVLELHKGAGHPMDLRLEGRPLVLIPLIYEGSVLVGNPMSGDAIAIGYQARGASALWQNGDAAPDERLELLLGQGRSAVLRALARPATTTELAARLHYAPSTVSAHLDVLARAGLVERHRVRRRVYYGLNDTGTSLVALLSDAPAALSA